ncbi:MAG: phosphonate ABC transporter, permease protein PhnE [Armatimonadetes bacterium]|nr:phosphonate ABC transporter, permease protein PhnE [Armatimonadota bacterium]
MGSNTETRTPRAPEVPRPGAGALRVILWLIFVGVIYAYGWQVTQINLGELGRKAYLITPLLTDLIRPDLIERRPRVQVANTGIGLDGAAAPAPLETRGPGRITISPTQAAIGARVTVSGEGFAPSRPVDVIWFDQSGVKVHLTKASTDASGRFQATVTVPNVIGAAHHIMAQVGLEGTTLGPSNALRLTLFRMVETVFLALMGTTLGVVLAVPLSFLGAKNLMARNPIGTFVYYMIRTVFNIARSIEPLILATVFAVWVGIGPFAGVLALGIHSIASLGKLYSEQIESIDPGPIEAITATGASMLQVVRYAVVPQIVPPFIAFTIYRWDINVRMSTVIGFVGGGGLGFLLMQYINLLQWKQAATAVWAITLVVAAMDYLSAVVREKVV